MSGRGYTILIVDDSILIKAVLIKSLGLAHIEIKEIYEAGNGKEGLDILRSKAVDLVLADINMPVMDGVTMVETMHNDPVLSKIPVIIISTEGSENRIEYLKKKGVKAYLRKPFTPDQLEETVLSVLGGKC